MEIQVLVCNPDGSQVLEIRQVSEDYFKQPVVQQNPTK
jgi:hypothetical protein